MNCRKLLKNRRGFTLVELMIVVAIIGVLAALAIYGVTKYMTNAKTAEARSSLGRLAKDAAAAYERESDVGLIAAGASATITRELCPSVTATVPAALTSVAGQKYQSQPSDWNGNGWDCLRFSMQGPQYFLYNYTADVSASFTATAQGDLDGDATASTFAIQGAITTGSDGQSFLRISGSIAETNPEE